MKGGRGRALAVLALLVLLVLAGRQAGSLLPAFAARVEALGVWGPIAFVCGYIVATVAFIPGSILSLAAGAIFGILEGTLYVFVGATIGSSLAFLISRTFARKAVEKRIRAHPRFDAIDRAVAARGGRLVFLLRLSPAVPYNLLNYALGLTNVRFFDYLLASVGMVPGILLYVYSGKVAGEVAALAGSPQVEKGAAYYVILTLGLAATAGATVLIGRMVRAALRESLGPGGG